MKKIYFVLLFFILTLNSVFAVELKTTADMLNYAAKEYEKTDYRYLIICEKIKRNFVDDKKFLVLFEEGEKSWRKLRIHQRDTFVSPSSIDNSEHSGTICPIDSYSFLTNITKKRIEDLRFFINEYCSVNYSDDEKKCSKKTVDSIFDN